MQLSWDDVSSRFYRVGLDHGVLYLYGDDVYGKGVAWNGLVGIDDASSGHEKTPLYTADIKSALVFSPKESAGTIRCFTYPDEFEQCIGHEELVPGVFAEDSDGVMFGLSYRTKIGNPVDPNYAYEIHIIYGAIVTEAKESASTIGENNDVSTMNFSFDCIPAEFEDHDPCAHLKIDSRKIPKDKLETIESILYGTSDSDPRLLLPDELMEIFAIPVEPEEYDGYPAERIYPETTIYPMQPTIEEEP